MASEEKQFQKLRSACSEGDVAAIAKVLASGMRADAFASNANGDSLLMSAIRRDKLDVVKLLVEEGGASFDYKNPNNDTALTYAIRYDRAEIIEYLASRGAPIERTELVDLPQDVKNARLFEALDDWTDDELPKRLKKLLAGGADPNARREGITPLLVLTMQSASGPELYKALVEGGADPALGDADGTTPFHSIADGGDHSPEARVFLEAGFPVDTRDSAGRTPLHRAAASAYWDSLKFVKWLVGEGADPMAKDASGKTPADHARGDVKKWLLGKTQPAMSADDKALLEAVGDGDVAKVKKALAAGANACVVDTSNATYGPNNAEGCAAIHVAMNHRLPNEIAELLLAAPNVDVNVAGIDGDTVLHHVLDKNKGDTRRALVDKLLALGADPQRANASGRTPVFELTSFYELTNELELLDVLAAAGARLDHKAGEGEETLVDAMYEKTQRFNEINDKHGFVAMLEKLVAAGVPTGDPSMMPHVETWLSSKGSKYGGTRTAAAPAPAGPTLAVDVSPAGELLEEETSVEIEGGLEPVVFFDWLKLERDEEHDNSTLASQIWEYHLNPALEELVKAYELVPFGIVGMTGTFDSLREMSVDGTMFVDQRRAKDGDAPVLFMPNVGGLFTLAAMTRLTENDEPRDISPSFKSLLASVVRGDVPATPKVKAKATPKTTAKAGAKTKPTTKAKATPKPAAKAKAKAKPTPKPKAKPTAKAGAKTKPAAKARPTAKTSAKTKPSKVKSGSKPKPAGKKSKARHR